MLVSRGRLLALAGGCGVAFHCLNGERLPSLDAKTVARSKSLGFVWRSWRQYQLEKVEDLSPTTKRFRFLFEDVDLEPGMRVVSTILGRKQLEKDVYVQAPFYPVTRNHEKGYFDVVVKKTQDPVTQYIHGLKIGQKAEFKGALPVLNYRVGQFTTLGVIAGGTGILPVYTLIQEILSNPQETTKISLLYAAKNKRELLFKKQLDKLADKHPTSFRVEYCVEEKPWFWSGHVGRVDKELVMQNMPRPGRGVTIAVAGPDAMLETICGPTELDKAGWVVQGPVKGILNECGFRNHHVFKF